MGERALGFKRLRTILVVCAFLALFLSLSYYVLPVRADDPSFSQILTTLGFTNVANTTIETFPPGTYNITLYAEFTQYLNSNVLNIYQVGTYKLTPILLASEGVNGYLSKPLTKTFTVTYQFGLALSRTTENPPFTYFTETAKNPSAIKYALVDRNLNVPSMFLIGFCESTYFEVLNFNAMVFSLQMENYLQVISPYDTPSGGGWYGNGTNAFASLTTGTVDQGNGTRRVFTQWSGDASGTDFSKSNPILMTQNRTAIANWKTQYYLTVGTVPSGIATIPGQDWYDENQKVTLTAPPVTGYNFSYWSVDGTQQTAGLNSVTVTMSGPHSATAYYTKIVTLTITTSAGGSTSPPVGSYTFGAGSNVQVTATPDSGYWFDHWELDGAEVGSANPYTVLMNADHTLKAVFVKVYTLTITTSAGGSTSPPVGVYTFGSGVIAQVAAVPYTGYALDHWELDGTKVGSTNPYPVLMNADHTLKAVFAIPPAPAPVGGYSYSVQKVKSAEPVAIYLPFIALLAAAITMIVRRKRNKK